MAEKKSKVKAHRGFAHVRLKPRRPQITRLPRRPIPSFNNQQLQKMSDAQLRRYFNAQRRRSIAQQLSSQSRKRFLDRIKRANLSPAQRGVEISRYNAYLSNLRRGLDAQGRPIPKGIDIVKQFRQQMKQQQRMPTQKQIEEARKESKEILQVISELQTGILLFEKRMPGLNPEFGTTQASDAQNKFGSGELIGIGKTRE